MKEKVEVEEEGEKEKEREIGEQHVRAKKEKLKKKKKENRKKSTFESPLLSETSQTTVEPENSDEDSHLESEILFVHQRNQELEKIYRKVSEKTDQGDKYRRVAVNRIGAVLQQLHLSFQVYGSYACGLTIPNSDVDICVDPTIVNFFYASFCSYRDKIIMSLEFLRNAFQKHPWVRKLSLIPAATVPILTFVNIV